MTTDLGWRDARVVQPDHVVFGDASRRQGSEQQVSTEVLWGAHEQACPLHGAVHLQHHSKAQGG